MAVHSPTVRRRRLGHELRRLREDAGLTLDEVGARLEWSGAKVSRIENARVRVSPRDVRDLLDLYDINDETQRKNLILLTREAREKPWWEDYSDAVRPGAMFVGFEAEAEAIRTFDAQVANGLLQTEDYARAVIRAVWTSEGPAEIERRVQLRMARQQVLVGDGAPQFWSVLEEAAIRRRVGGREVLQGQLRRLVEAAEMPNVTLQVLPFSVGAHAGVDGGFMITEFPGPDPDIVYVEYRTGALFLENKDQVVQYNRVFDRLQAKAIDPDESVELITKIAADL